MLSYYHRSAHNKLGYICIHSLASLFNVGMGRGAPQRCVNGGFISHILFLNQQNSAFEGGPSFLFFFFLPNPGQKPSFRVRMDVHDCIKSQEPLLKTATGVCKQVTETPSLPIPPGLSKLPLKHSQLLCAQQVARPEHRL